MRKPPLAMPKIKKDLQCLIGDLGSETASLRTRARKALVELGVVTVPSLVQVLKHSRDEKARWEAAKILGEIGDPKALPALIMALADPSGDVGWVAARAVQRFGTEAWPPLLRQLARMANSLTFRTNTHHVLIDQHGLGRDDMVDRVLQALESDDSADQAVVVAHQALRLLRA